LPIADVSDTNRAKRGFVSWIATISQGEFHPLKFGTVAVGDTIRPFVRDCLRPLGEFDTVPKKAKNTDERRISQMRNLGPACEEDLNAVGIYTAQDLIDTGIEAAFIKLLQGRVARGLPTHGCNAAYLYALHGALHDCDWRDVPETKKVEYKKWTAEIRAAGTFTAKPGKP
jgi:DNA transformation protein and related proteins